MAIVRKASNFRRTDVRVKQRPVTSINKRVVKQPKEYEVGFHTKMKMWWENRVADGCQVSDLSLYEVGYHFLGEGRWKKAMRTTVLYSDFCRYNGEDVNPHVFAREFGKMLGDKIERKSYRVSIRENGETILRPLVFMYKFKALAEYV